MKELKVEQKKNYIEMFLISLFVIWAISDLYVNVKIIWEGFNGCS